MKEKELMKPSELIPQKTLNNLRDEALRIAVEHGFKDASPAEDIALVHSELSEALEDLRAGHAPNHLWYEEKQPGSDIPMPLADTAWSFRDGENKPCGVPSEMADVIIRVLHFCGKHNIDIERAVHEKMIYNDKRPFKHGKKF